MKYFVIVGLLLSSVFAHAFNSISLTVDKNQKSFTITLPANPTTGYQWTVKSYNVSQFKLLKKEYTPAPTNRIGSGGHTMFTFSSIKTYPKNTTMVFEYARPWEKIPGTLQKVIINFK